MASWSFYFSFSFLFPLLTLHLYHKKESWDITSCPELLLAFWRIFEAVSIQIFAYCGTFCACFELKLNLAAYCTSLTGRQIQDRLRADPVSSRFDSAWFGSAWQRPLYAQSKQARGYKAFTRQSCPTFPLCASAAGLRCIIHEHSVNLLIQNMSSLFLCLIYCLSFCHSVIHSLFTFCSLFFSPLFPILLFIHQQANYGTWTDTTTD